MEVRVAVGVGVSVAVAVGVGVCVEVAVGVGVLVSVAVGVGVAGLIRLSLTSIQVPSGRGFVFLSNSNSWVKALFDSQSSSVSRMSWGSGSEKVLFPNLRLFSSDSLRQLSTSNSTSFF